MRRLKDEMKFPISRVVGESLKLRGFIKLFKFFGENEGLFEKVKKSEYKEERLKDLMKE